MNQPLAGLLPDTGRKSRRRAKPPAAGATSRRMGGRTRLTLEDVPKKQGVLSKVTRRTPNGQRRSLSGGATNEKTSGTCSGLNNADNAEGPAGTFWTEGYVGSSEAALGPQLCRWGGRATPQAASPCAYKPDSPRQDNEPTSGHVPVKLQMGPQVRMQHEDAWLRLATHGPVGHTGAPSHCEAVPCAALVLAQPV